MFQDGLRKLLGTLFTLAEVCVAFDVDAVGQSRQTAMSIAISFFRANIPNKFHKQHLHNMKQLPETPSSSLTNAGN